MRKAGLPVLVLAATVLCVRFSAGQDSGQDRPHTDTLVKIPAAPNHEFDYAQVMVDGFTRKVYPGDDAHFALANCPGTGGRRDVGARRVAGHGRSSGSAAPA